ncbi:ATP-dependent Clp protease proteolytic subunit [Polynucleobacter sp. JS-JIR-5-A7]|uniref:ATP-dependent Clp protease proteolytic subunit n=1 Tax=Polynucleobacter sp. JS-JIR-5-A7 TaxID=1758395 RepID=UPI001BFDE811|nr:ATP-dependent Clp protease proteolytic subunit [Polynucleobacter sp. JS-JIR-5-A7]QWE06391.1 ATP-dependent Clp protease proteolytic subunit [Polynucleobacter sp. JS-JIR-5-A7]
MKYITLTFLCICSVLIFILFTNEQIATQRYDNGLITYQFSNPNNCVIKISGLVDEDLGYKFSDVLSLFEKKNCKKISLYLNSNGGKLLYSIEIGKTVREKNIETFITDSCDSACGYIFVGGVKRNIQKYRTMGFHQASVDDGRCISMKTAIDSIDRKIIELGYNHIKMMLNDKSSKKWISYEEMTSCKNMLQVGSSELLKDGIVDTVFD